VADQRRARDVVAIEVPQDIVGVRVEVGGRHCRVVVVWPQTGQGQGVNGVTGTLQQRNHRLERPGALPSAGHKDERRHAFLLLSSRTEARCLDDMRVGQALCATEDHSAWTSVARSGCGLLPVEGQLMLVRRQPCRPSPIRSLSGAKDGASGT
jgi:hypothetical protein